jgi:hypothetical protein
MADFKNIIYDNFFRALNRNNDYGKVSIHYS